MQRIHHDRIGPPYQGFQGVETIRARQHGGGGRTLHDLHSARLPGDTAKSPPDEPPDEPQGEPLDEVSTFRLCHGGAGFAERLVSEVPGR
jgi:hypothetical protein